VKILVFGSSGMIGSAILRVLSQNEEWQVYGTARNSAIKQFFNPLIGSRIIIGIDVEQSDSMIEVLGNIKPNVVINCVGITKHKPFSDNPLFSVPINSLMPHKLANLCELIGARLIHISTDCVFSGIKGNYSENDVPDARDVYGKSKQLGEVDYQNTLTLRTSTIGHELESKFGLLDWFLSQQIECRGYSRAFFSGLPTVIFAEIIRDIIIPRPELSGLYHVSAKSINKFDLLKLIARVYDKKINIIADEQLIIDRSLDSTRFQLATGYVAPEWPELIRLMHGYK